MAASTHEEAVEKALGSQDDFEAQIDADDPYSGDFEACHSCLLVKLL